MILEKAARLFLAIFGIGADTITTTLGSAGGPGSTAAELIELII